MARTQFFLSKRINSAKCQVNLSLASPISSSLFLWSILPLQTVGHLTCAVGQFNLSQRERARYFLSIYPSQCLLFLTAPEGFLVISRPCAFPPGVSNFPLLSHLLLTPSSLLLLAAVCQNQYSHSCQRQLRLAHHKRQQGPHFQIKINPATSAPSDNVFDMPVLRPDSLALTRHRHDHGSSHGHLAPSPYAHQEWPVG